MTATTGWWLPPTTACETWGRLLRPGGAAVAAWGLAAVDRAGGWGVGQTGAEAWPLLSRHARRPALPAAPRHRAPSRPPPAARFSQPLPCSCGRFDYKKEVDEYDMECMGVNGDRKCGFENDD